MTRASVLEIKMIPALSMLKITNHVRSQRRFGYLKTGEQKLNSNLIDSIESEMLAEICDLPCNFSGNFRTITHISC